MSFRQAAGRRIEWLNTGIDQGFSNFLFVDRRYRSNNILRRIFSLARKHDFRSLLIEEIAEADYFVKDAMAGRKQHFIQRLLLKGFSFDADRETSHVWVYRRDGKTFAPALEGYGAERDFYGNPEVSGLDSQITNIESDRFNEFQNDLRKGPDRPVEAQQAAAFAIYVFFRSKHLRSMESAGLEPLVARVRELLRSDDMVEKLLLQPASLPASMRAGFRNRIDPILPALVKVRVKERRPQIQAYLDGVAATVSEVVASRHRQTLEARLYDLSGTCHAQLVALQWKIVTVKNDLILGDSVVFVELTDGTFKPVTEPNDALASVWLPIESRRVLVGSPVGNEPDVAPPRINRGAAACSFDAFCAKLGPDEHRSLISQIRTSTFSLDAKAIERIANETLTKVIS